MGAKNRSTKKDNNSLNSQIRASGKCPQCNEDVFGTIYCSVICSAASKRKVERPNRKDLEHMIQNLSFCAIARRYKVSDNAVRKWAKYYGLI